MQKKMDGGTEKNRAKGLVTALGRMLGEALQIITSANGSSYAAGGGHRKY